MLPAEEDVAFGFESDLAPSTWLEPYSDIIGRIDKEKQVADAMLKKNRPLDTAGDDAGNVLHRAMELLEHDLVKAHAHVAVKSTPW